MGALQNPDTIQVAVFTLFWSTAICDNM